MGPYNPLMVEEGDTAAMLCEVSLRVTGIARSNPLSSSQDFLKRKGRNGKSCDNKLQEMDVGN